MFNKATYLLTYLKHNSSVYKSVVHVYGRAMWSH